MCIEIIKTGRFIIFECFKIEFISSTLVEVPKIERDRERAKEEKCGL